MGRIEEAVEREMGKVDEAVTSRQHYVRVAQIISNVEDRKVRQQLADEFGNWFLNDNPHFDAGRFRSACNVKEK